MSEDKEEFNNIDIRDRFKYGFMNYSLAVITDRVLPDVRDGLKPVHRRILYATDKLGLTPDKPHKKSARIVGEVLGKYHPHGDKSVYDAMVKMAQDFSYRYPLIDGHGNFGSIDGDSAAAMRYTEARLDNLSEEFLEDIEENTVDFQENFDGSLEEPKVLPTKVPNVLVNGAKGIAVGMSTSIPPHNLNDILEAGIKVLDNPNVNIEKLINIVKAPDFPTGGSVIKTDKLIEGYKTGNGKTVLRGKADIERNKIIIKEIPYRVNKSKLIESIAKLVKKDKIKYIKNLRDESDRDGIRIVIELKSQGDADIILNQLYKNTKLQKNIRINLLVLKNGKPQVLNLKEILKEFISFRQEVVKRRTKTRLEKAKAKEKKLLAIKKAIDKLDEVISIIRGSKSNSKAKDNLCQELNIDNEEASSILNIRLSKLVRMEVNSLKKKIEEVQSKIEKLKEILNNSKRLNQVVREELKQVKNKYGEKRRTDIIASPEKAKITKEDLIKEEEVVISLSKNGLIKRTNDKDKVKKAKDDYIIDVFEGKSYDDLLFFTKNGKSYSLNIHEVEKHHGLANGDKLSKYIELPFEEEFINRQLLNKKTQKGFITFITSNGKVKKTKGEKYESKQTTLKTINLKGNSEIVNIDLSINEEEEKVLLVTEKGYTIKFENEEVNDTGRNTQGSTGIKLTKGDKVVNGFVIPKEIEEDKKLVLINKDQNIKKVAVEDLKTQGRNGKGKQIFKNIKFALLVEYSEDLIVTFEDGQVKKVSEGQLNKLNKTIEKIEQK